MNLPLLDEIGRFLTRLPAPGISRPMLLACAAVLAIIALYALFRPRRRTAVVARLGGLVWKRTQFCRGWLITGDTGSGKTS
ncbi:MAG: hypothetical protein KIT22_20755, partial [Verrucomicrobiae bacterium]|nr:hypothetical protein [Verrucomicrobiae bacterium]